MHTMHKGIGLNRQDAKVSEEDSPRTHAALTGICRSGGSADTLIREFIRVSRCPAPHVRIADSAACHASPTNFLFCCDWCSWRLGGSIQSGIFLASAAHTSASPRLRVTPFPELNFWKPMAFPCEYSFRGMA